MQERIPESPFDGKINDERIPVIINTDKDYILTCPWCYGSHFVLKNELNCTIFRCGMNKDNTIINPHLRKEEAYIRINNKDIIEGCAGPFQVIKINDKELYIIRRDWNS